MDGKFDEITQKLENLIATNSVETIFDISDEFDKVIQAQEGTTMESRAFIYQRAY